MPNISINQVVGNKYRVIEFLATGGMGAVYKVFDLEKNVYLVMKVLNIDVDEDPSALRRFKREANAYRKLSHPHIVPYYGLEQIDDLVFILQNYIDGDSLKGILSNYKNKPFPINETLVIMKAVCAALGYAHINGVVHCDIKPGNILIDRGGNVFLTDFGIARHADSSTTTIAGAGTAAYMAPEQIKAEPVNPATDVYGLGCMLFELLTGRRPFRGDSDQESASGNTMAERLRYAHLNITPPDPRSIKPNLSQDVANVIFKSLAKKPSERYQTTNEFFEALCKAFMVHPEDMSERIKPEVLFKGYSESPIVSKGWQEPQILSPQKGKTDDKKPSAPKWIYYVVGGIIITVIGFAILPRGGGFNPLLKESETPSLTPTQATSTSTITPTNTARPSSTPTPTVVPPLTSGYNIAFVSNKDGGMNLYLAREGEMDQAEKVLPPDGYSEIRWPSFCGDLVAAEVFGSNPQWIYLYDPASMKWSRYTGLPSSSLLGVPRCSPDGKYIAYSFYDTSTKLFLTRFESFPDGDHVYSPQTNGSIDGNVTYSNIGYDFFMMSISRNQEYRIYRSDGFNRVEFFRDGQFPAVSPDGQQLAFVGMQNVRPIMLKNLINGEEKIIVEQLKAIKINNKTYYALGTPVWSPDGKWVYFASAIDGDWDIYRVDPKTNIIENLTKNWPSNELMPAIQWQR